MINSKIIIITAIITGKLSEHKGSFSHKKIISYAEQLDSSPMFCDVKTTYNNTQIVILTDSAALYSHKFNNTLIVKVETNKNFTETNSYRFILIEEYLKKRKNWLYSYMIDASDVVIFKRPLTQPNQFVVGVDNAKKWLGNLMLFQNYTPSYNLQVMIKSKHKIMYNSGIVGGSRSNVLHFLKYFKTRYYEYPKVYDMIHVNEYFVNTNKTLTLGYPYGPVHLPFWGTPIGCKDVQCRHKFLRETIGNYWFGHKIPIQWKKILENEYFCKNNNKNKNI